MADLLPRSHQLYQLVAISRDQSRTVLMKGLTLDQANAARDAIPKDGAIVWFMVEREPYREEFQRTAAMEEFQWLFPCYILVGIATIDDSTGEVVVDDKLQFVTTEVWSEMSRNGPAEQQMAVFTDRAAADEYLDGMTLKGARVCSIPTIEKLEELLVLAHRNYRHVVVDVNRKTRQGRSMLIEELLAQMPR